MNIKKKNLKLFIQIFLFLIPVGLIQNSIIMIIWYIALTISIGIFLLKIIVTHNRKCFKGVLPYMFLYLVLQSVATYINGGEWLYSIFTTIIVCILIIFSQYYYLKDAEQFISVFDTVLSIEILIESTLYIIGTGSFLMDFACVYVFYGVWVGVHIINSLLKGKKTKTIYVMTVFIILLTVIKPQLNADGTSNYEWTFYVLATVGCALYITIGTSYRKLVFLNIRGIYLAVIAFNLLMVIYQNISLIPGLGYIITNIMHKDVTLSGRTSIWAMTISFIRKRPILGYGTGFTSLVESNDYWINWLGIHGPHNQFLAICLAGGIVTLMAYLLLIFVSTKDLMKYKRYPVSMAACVGLLTVYIELSLTYRNIINCMPLFILFVITRHIGELAKKYNWGDLSHEH